MGREIGDLLVREERLIRPSKAFVYLVTGEIGPDAYPEFAIAEFRDECRQEYKRRKLARTRRNALRRARRALATAITNRLVEFVLLNERLKSAAAAAPRSGMALDGAAPRSLAVLRALG